MKDYRARAESGTLMKPIGHWEFDRHESHKLQLKTIDEFMHFVEHGVEVSRYVVPVDNDFPELRCIHKDEIEILAKVTSCIFKVKFEGKVLCVKIPRPAGRHHGGLDHSFVDQIEKLRKVCHPNVLQLHGVVESSEGKVMGTVMRFISGSDLAAVRSATQLQKEEWKAKISDAVACLHKNDVVWGDAKPENIMIDSVTNEPILIDFEGGGTDGWVDEHLHDTQAGDIQGLGRILKFIDDIPSACAASVATRDQE